MEDDRFVYLSQTIDIRNSNLELRVRIINANYGHSHHILNKCPALYEYSWFLQEIRIRYNKFVENSEENNGAMIKIVNEVLEIMPEDFVIRDIIRRHKAKAADMLDTIEDEPRMRKIHEEAIRNKGRREGRTEAIKETIELLTEAGLSEQEATIRAEEKFKTSS